MLISVVTKVTKENGATEVVPKSNIWDDIRKPKEEEVTYGEMDAGDAIFCLGNTFHGAGGNTTVDDFRSVVVTLFCKGRQLPLFIPPTRNSSRWKEMKGNE